MCIFVNFVDLNVVYVGVVGWFYGISLEWGVYKIIDGGEIWENVLFVDDWIGVIDMIMYFIELNIIIVVCWDCMCDGFDVWLGSVVKLDGIDGYDLICKWGFGGGLYKIIDGGVIWKKLE